MKLGRKAAALAVAALAIVAAASPARAADIFDTTEGGTRGNNSSTGGTWAASQSLTAAGAFAVTASVDDPVTGVDSNEAEAYTWANGYTTLTLAPGAYTIKAVLHDVSGNGTATGFASGAASVNLGLRCQLDRCAPLDDFKSTTLVTTSDGAVDEDEVVVTSRYIISQAHTAQVHFSTTAWASSAHTSGHVVGVGAAYHGGTASVSLSGTVAEITAVPE